MGNKEFAEIAIDCVVKLYNEKLKGGVIEEIKKEDVYIVWLCKTLQNNKALLATNRSDRRYFEVTYNGDKKEVYIDDYIKLKNTCIQLGDTE